MVTRRITPLLLAASVLVTGFTGGFINCQPASAITSVEELADVNRSTWAYEALETLVEKYNVIEGYPDRTFRGNRTASRYELAAALNATIKAIGKEIARLGAEKADKEDLATVARLQEELGTELKTIQAKTEALEARAVRIEAKNNEQDNRLAILEKLKVYGDVNFGGYGDIAGNPGTAFTDSIGAVGRTRINFDYPVVEDKGGSVVGPGTIHSRLVAAFGRVSPLDASTAVGGVGLLGNNRFSGASRIAGDSSLYNEGIRTNDLINVSTGTTVSPFGTGYVSGTNVRANAYVDSAYYSQVLRAELPFIPQGDEWRTSFTFNMGLIPWRDLYFKSPYVGNEGTQFQNTALINNPAILVDNTVPRFALEMRQGLGRWANLALKADASFMDVAFITNGVGLTAEADIGYNLGFLDEMIGTQSLFNVSGNIFGGYYLVDSNNGATNNLVNVVVDGVAAGQIPVTAGFGETAYGFYGGMNQEIYKGIGAFGSIAVNNTGPVSQLLYAMQNGNGSNVALNNSLLGGVPLVYGLRQAWTAGVQIPVRALPNFLTFGKRQRDILGVAGSFLFANTAFGSPSNGVAGIPLAGGREKIVELYYKMQVSDGFSIIPSAQLIVDRAGWAGNDAEVVVGFRSNFTF